MPTIQGRCHCGNLQATLTTDRKPQEMWLRACQCSFCRPHNMRSLSDADGRLRISVQDAGQLNRYRFGLGTADFLICRNCGNYIGAVQEVDGRLYGIMNANLTADRGAAFGEGEHRFYEEESAEERAIRRQKVWTPADLAIDG